MGPFHSSDSMAVSRAKDLLWPGGRAVCEPVKLTLEGPGVHIKHAKTESTSAHIDAQDPHEPSPAFRLRMASTSGGNVAS